MAIGDILNPKRVRTQANERLDVADADAVSFVAREFLDAHSRAIEAAPRNVGSSTPTGLIVQGFGLTLNPTGPTDAKIRVQSAVGVAFDANGRLLIKEAGVQVDLILSTGNSQIYAYYVETASDSTVRRVISVSSPFAEGSASISTKLKGDVAFFVRTGDQTSIVASDVVNGATTALCFLGVANNSGGAVTMTGYNGTTAPNGAFATNRITTVTTPATLPQANTAGGSITAMHGLVTAALYMIGQALWKGSVVSPPTTANNFQAWTPHTMSVATLSEYLVAGNFVGASTFDSTVSVTGVLTALAGIIGGVGTPISALNGITVPTGVGVTLFGTTSLTMGSGALTVNTGNIVAGGSLITNGLLRLTAEATANSVGTSQNDFNPSGFSIATVLLINSSTTINITGFVPGASGGGRLVYIYNNGSNNITLTNQDAASAAANRIIGRSAANTVLTPATAVTLYYSSFTSRWLVMSDTL